MSPFARAHSRTRATSASVAISRMCGVDVGEPISSSGFADEREALERKASPLVDQRLEGVAAGEQPGLHVGHARAVREAVVDREGPLGGGPRIEDGVHVTDEEDPRSTCAAGEGRDDGIAETSGRVRPALDRRPETAEEIGRPLGDPVHAFDGVAAAVDIDQRPEVIEVPRKLRRDRHLQRVQFDRPRRTGQSGRKRPWRAV